MYIYICTYIYIYSFYLTYASKVRATCIIVPQNDGSKAPIRLSRRGMSCAAFARSGMLDMVLKDKLSRLFSLVSIQG